MIRERALIKEHALVVALTSTLTSLRIVLPVLLLDVLPSLLTMQAVQREGVPLWLVLDRSCVCQVWPIVGTFCLRGQKNRQHCSLQIFGCACAMFWRQEERSATGQAVGFCGVGAMLHL